MKKLLFLIFILKYPIGFAQTTFQYDVMGNRISKANPGNPSMGNLQGSAAVNLNQTVAYSLSNPSSGYTYAWEVGNGTFVSSSSGNPASVNWNINSTPSFIKLTITENGCKNTKTMPVVVSGAAPCAGSSLTLTNPGNNQSQGKSLLKAGIAISATNKHTGGTLVYEAGKSIVLSPGFEARGAMFEAQVKGCN